MEIAFMDNLLFELIFGTNNKKINHTVDCKIKLIDVFVPIETIYELFNLSSSKIRGYRAINSYCY